MRTPHCDLLGRLFDGDVDDAPPWAGESVAVVNDIEPAAEIVADLVSVCRQVDPTPR